MTKRVLLLAVGLFSVFSLFSQERKTYQKETKYEAVKVTEPKGKKVKNVILMIADGMGLEQLSAAYVANGGSLNMTDNFSNVGLQWNYAANNLITDSAAAGTALATGNKTNIGLISMSPEGETLQTLVEYAKSKGKKVGASVSCRISDATPAVFFTHALKRDSLYNITAQFAESDIDFLTGGGLKWWEKRPDGRNLIAEVRAKGYTFVTNLDSLDMVKSTPIIGIFAKKEFPDALSRGDMHERTVRKALELLQNKNGFFLMIEGSRIDDYGHGNDVGAMMEEILDFDRIVGRVLEWAEKDGETLVVVTADHSTGGLILHSGNIEKQIVVASFASNVHNGIVTPVFAWGPQSENFIGIYQNTDLSNKIKALIK